MDSLADLLDADSDRTAIEQPARSSHPISLGQLTKTAYKTGNYLRHLGVGPGTTVAIADDTAPEPLYALFGAALLGATVRFGPTDDWRVLVGPTADVIERAAPAGSTRLAYGGQPDDPTIAHFGTDVWSENPTFPDDGHAGQEATLLETADGTYTHGAILDAAQTVVEEGVLTDDDVVVVRAPLSNIGGVAVGIVAPVLVGATILLPGADRVGTVAVGVSDAPEPRVVDPDEVWRFE